MIKTRTKQIHMILKILIVFLVACYLIRTFVIGKPITSFYSNNPNKITRIEIMSGNTGDIKTITSNDDIKAITEYLNNLKFKKRLPPLSCGWAYSVTAYADEKKLIELVDMGDIYTINDRYYSVISSKNTELRDLLGSYMN